MLRSVNLEINTIPEKKISGRELSENLKINFIFLSVNPTSEVLFTWEIWFFSLNFFGTFNESLGSYHSLNVLIDLQSVQLFQLSVHHVSVGFKIIANI